MLSAPSSFEPLINTHRRTASSIQTVPRDLQQSRACQHQRPQTSAAPTLPPRASSKSEARPFNGFPQVIIGSGAKIARFR
ncbi:hypothetical protein NDU88_001090 [Pleurodeles waltl]|uniref:Uncharacterized protein n=1 Tax=Pleurodeles waltl TaxID=8319 RepID=A0AAV7VYE7_PLEWA|nr:hypothetical protein NDU88_001090 [Pleurodeles waltl]